MTTTQRSAVLRAHWNTHALLRSGQFDDGAIVSSGFTFTRFLLQANRKLVCGKYLAGTSLLLCNKFVRSLVLTTSTLRHTHQDNPRQLPHLLDSTILSCDILEGKREDHFIYHWLDLDLDRLCSFRSRSLQYPQQSVSASFELESARLLLQNLPPFVSDHIHKADVSRYTILLGSNTLHFVSFRFYRMLSSSSLFKCNFAVWSRLCYQGSAGVFLVYVSLR